MKIIGKKYYMYRLCLKSGMNIGSGENVATDRDLIKNSKGIPYLPGTSLCGIYRSLFSKADRNTYFGKDMEYSKEGKLVDAEITESRVLVYDANLEGDTFRISHRDCVAIQDETKASKDTAKFDLEVLEPGVVFVSLFEQNIYGEEDKDIGLEIANYIKANGLTVGGKTSRGLGLLELDDIDSVKSVDFDFTKPDEKKAWILFDPLDADSELWNVVFVDGENYETDEHHITIQLAQRGGLSIRRYTTEINTSENPEPDYEQITYGENETPFIPGTSWSGVFRHQLMSLGISKDTLDRYFGCIGEKKHRSLIRFEESVVQDTTAKLITRNAINRFTGGTIQGALYTERSRFDGHTMLVIHYPKHAEGKLNRAFAACIADLHQGIMSLGGLTAVGRGLFEIESLKIDGTPWESLCETPEEIVVSLWKFVVEALDDTKEAVE